MLHAMAAAVLAKRRRRRARLRRRRRPLRRGRRRGQARFSPTRSASCWRATSPKLHPGATFVVDVKSTGLFATDPELVSRGVKVDYWKTGHSHIKRRVRDLAALAGFEKSGHFFFNAPVGRGYDDGFVTADRRARHARPQSGEVAWPISIASCRRPGVRRPCRRIAPTKRNTPSSTRVVGALRGDAGGAAKRSPGRRSATSSPSTARASTVEDGTWGLVRASSNKPELVVVVESPVSEARMREMFAAVDAVLAREPRGRRL